MNRVDFMNQLESLLQSISSTEREEAIQYYNDYFDDAGEENEQEVIEALGNPARVAENIKRDLAGNGYGEGFAQKVKASDRVLMEYGKNIPEDSEEPQDSEESPAAGQTGAGTAGNSGQKSADAASEGILDSRAAGYGFSRKNNAWQPEGQTGNTPSEYSRKEQNSASEYSRQGQDSSSGYNREEQNFSSAYGRETGNASGGYVQSSGTYSGSQSDPFEDYGNGSRYASGTGSGGAWEQNTVGSVPEKRKKGEGMPVWAIAMLITVLILASPILGAMALGALGIIVGGLAGWFGLIFGFGATTLVLLVLMLVLTVVGIICFFVSPWVGIALVGGGLICGSIGLLFLMLTVAMAGIVTPAVCRGIAFVFRGFKRKRALAN
ncbi:MAG: DUF1700 domain-containing protein [Lachnospiraceae bacterium]|nr:DUF1700 domain-containing protein [Lachnospiraceae bacterium]